MPYWNIPQGPLNMLFLEDFSRGRKPPQKNIFLPFHGTLRAVIALQDSVR